MSSAPKHALVADDEDLTCRALDRALTAEGFAVELAKTREELIGRLIGAGYDLLVVSCSIGHERVCDLVKEVRKYRPTTQVIALVEPADGAGDPDADECADAARIEKPFCMNDLIAAARRLTQLTAPAETASMPRAEHEA